MEIGQDPAAHVGQGLFVGREAEVTALQDLVSDVAAGRGGLAWVEGEPGIGKSALVSQGLSKAVTAGCAVLTAPADRLRQQFPLGVMLDLLRVDTRSADGDRKQIVRFLRGDGMGEVVSARNTIAVAAERLLGLVDRLCAASPVICVIDDVQWADEASLSVWRRLAAAVGQIPLLAIAVAGTLPRSPEVAEVRSAVLDRGGVAIAVPPLPDDEAAALVAALVGGQPGPRLLQQAASAAGNPLYIRELTETLLREDRVQASQGVAELTRPPGAVTLAAAIGDRLGFLSEPTLDALRVAALLGARFSVQDLAAALGRMAQDLVDEVGEGVAAGVLAEAGPELAFRHGLIQQALRDGMPVSLRMALHRDTARAMAGAGTPPERVAAQLLAVQGTLDDWMLGWLAASGAALAYLAPQCAADLLRRAMARLTADDPRREVVQEHLAWTLFLLGRNDQAEPLARQLLARTSAPVRRARMAWTVGYTLLRTRRPGEALAIVGAALQSPGLPPVWEARHHALRALLLANTSRYDEARAAVAEVQAEAERIGDRIAAGYALHTASLDRYHHGDDTGALAKVELALAVIGDDPEATDLRLLLLGDRLAALAGLGREAFTEMREAAALAELAGAARAGMVRWMTARYLWAVGQWDGALAELDALFRPGASVSDEIVPIAARGLAALICFHLDDRAGVAAHLRAAESLADPGHPAGVRKPRRWQGLGIADRRRQSRCHPVRRYRRRAVRHRGHSDRTGGVHRGLADEHAQLGLQLQLASIRERPIRRRGVAVRPYRPHR